METVYNIAGRGLKRMAIGQIVALVSIVVLLIPVFGITGLIAMAVGGIMSIVGLWGAREAHEGYKRAFVMLIAGGVLSILGTMAGDGGVGTLFDVLDSVAGMLQTYFVCTATSGLLREIGEEQEASRGDLVWKLNALCYIIAIVIAIVSVVSAGVGGALNVVRTIVSLVANVIYIIFLYKSQQIMLA